MEKVAARLQRGVGVALWRQIADAIRAGIANGLADGAGRLPPEAELAERFGANRHTVRAAIAALAIGFFNSIMFPTIFTLTLERSSAPVASTSGLLCMSIVGGALLPVLFGHVADISGIAVAFVIPMVAYFGIAAFAAAAARVRVQSVVAAPSAH